MDKNIWLIKESFTPWDSPEFKDDVPNKKSFTYFFEKKEIEMFNGDIFFGIDKDLQYIINLGAIISNSFMLSNKKAVFLLPKYYFKKPISFKDFSLWIMGQNFNINELKENSIIEISKGSWNDILNQFKKQDKYLFEYATYLENYYKQRKYLNNILDILYEFGCDYNETQEIFLILRNLLNWNPEYADGQNELEEMLTFLRYSLHIEDLNYDQRTEILDKLIYNWIQFVNFFPNSLMEKLQNIKEKFIL